MITKRIDWNATADKAAKMTDDQLHYALIDIQKTLPSADAMDREFGTDNGGYYRDEATVLRAEQRNRRSKRQIAELKR